VPRFNEAGAIAVELMDGNTLRASVSVQGVPADWAELPKETAALLVEFRASDESGQEAYERAAAAVVEGLDLVVPVASVTNEFTREAKVILEAPEGVRHRGRRLPPDRYDSDNRGLRGPAIAARRRLRSPPPAPGGPPFRRRCRRPCRARKSAFPARVRCGSDVDRYAAFMGDFCRLTVERFDGSLKAEHATGRNIAPFLELEWGPKATELMWRTKQVIDPDGCSRRGSSSTVTRRPICAG
jgi:D-lactate dehydrogenase